MKIGTIQSMACVGLGALFGAFAATRDMTPSSRAGVDPRPDRQVAAQNGATDTVVRQPSSCSEGSARNVLLARADAKAPSARAETSASGKKPNIVMIMGDDVGWFNIGAYHQGIMASRTPNLDRLAAEGMRFTDYYAEASCTAGRANFITGQLPIRTGLTTVGQAGATIGMPAQRRPLPRPSSRWDMPRASSVKITSATATNSCRPCMVSMSSSGTFITWTRWKTRSIATTRPR